MLVNEQAPTSDLTKALSRLAGNRHSDGVSSIVSADDRNVIINGCYEMMVALRSQPPLHERQGMKVKELEWIASRMSDNSFIAQSGFGDNYVAYLTRDEFWRCVCKDFPSLEAAKAAAQADYEARIKSAIEVAPSPRAQALEEAAAMLEAKAEAANSRAVTFTEKLSGPLKGRKKSEQWRSEKTHNERIKFYYHKAATAVRALSSQPVAVGWLPIETAPKDGTMALEEVPHADKTPQKIVGDDAYMQLLFEGYVIARRASQPHRESRNE